MSPPQLQEEQKVAGDSNGFPAPDAAQLPPTARFYIGDGRASLTDTSLFGGECGSGDDVVGSGDEYDDEVAAEPPHVVPPDGGWGWVVVAASFFCCFIVDGDIFTFGNFARHIQSSFNESLSRIALVGSLQSGAYLLVGPFVSALANRFGFRAVTIAGSLLCTLGFLMSAFATSSFYLCITYGLMSGIGFGFVYVPSVLTVSFYFERRRALATGIAVCGSGIGTFVMSILSNYLIEVYGWRGALFVKAGFSLQCAVLGALFRPLPVTKPESFDEEQSEKQRSRSRGSGYDSGESDGKRRRRKSSAYGAPDVPLLMRIKKARDDQLKQCESIVSFASSTGPPALPNERQRSVSQCEYIPQGRNFSSQSLKLRMDRCERGTKRLSVPILDGNYECDPEPVMEDVEEVEEEEAEGTTENGEAIVENSKPTINGVDGNKNIVQCENRNNNTPTRRQSEVSTARQRRRRYSRTEGMRPFYREDIFFSASLLRLPQYTSKTNIDDFHASVTRVPTMAEFHRDEQECHICSLAFRKTLGTMLDCSLLTSPSFLLLCFCGFLTMMGFFVPYMYLTDMAMAAGVEEESAKYLLAHLGIMNTACRVVCGWISDHPRINALFITNVALTIGGACTIVSPFLHDDTLLLIYSSIFGGAVACFASLRSIILVDLLGLERLTNAFGLLLLFQGLAATIGTPVAAAFYDSTGDYAYSFYLSGILLALSGILCYPLGCINNWEKRRKAGAPHVKVTAASPQCEGQNKAVPV